MATVYSFQFFAYHGLSGAANVVTVSANQKWILRDIDCYCGNNVPTPVLFIQGHLGQTIFWATGNETDSAYNSWRGRQVFNAGQTMRVVVTEGTWDVTGSGYHLTLP